MSVAQGKMGSLDGAWQIEMSDEDEMADRFKIVPKKVRLARKFKKQHGGNPPRRRTKIIIEPNGMTLKQCENQDQWPDDHLLESEKEAA
jgi:hypothetical protein